MFQMLSSDPLILKVIQTIFQIVGTIVGMLWVLVQFGDRLWRLTGRNGGNGGSEGDRLVHAPGCDRVLSQIQNEQKHLRARCGELDSNVGDLKAENAETHRILEDMRRNLGRCTASVAEHQKAIKYLESRRH